MSRDRNPPIFLLGLMGAGKSAVGRALAAERGVVFIDLDVRIERMFGSSIAALFERGEPEFRARERLALTSLVAEPGFSGSGAVVATGGGTVGDPSNLAAIQAVGISVYLRVEIATLVDRLTREDERARRPLLVGDGVGDVDLAARLTELLALREPAYARASATVDGGAEVAVIVAEITEAITRSQ